jgi:hypothetical protein
MPEAPPDDRTAEGRLRIPGAGEHSPLPHADERGQPSLGPVQGAPIGEAALIGGRLDAQRRLGAVTQPEDAREAWQVARPRPNPYGLVPVGDVEAEPIQDLVFGRPLGGLHPPFSHGLGQRTRREAPDVP